MYYDHVLRRLSGLCGNLISRNKSLNAQGVGVTMMLIRARLGAVAERRASKKPMFTTLSTTTFRAHLRRQFIFLSPLSPTACLAFHVH